ncbi:MAG TPA: hypothetical protein VHD56_05595 [Tepidisphaeraceae bacterium]|nr:hypothetical protein [Tepidisphaeraceae bacterium]
MKARSKKLLKQSPVELNHDQRIEVCKSLHAALIEREVEVVEMSIGAKHWHLLARFTAPNKLSPRDPKIIVGEAKGKCSFILSRQGIVKPGGIWAAGCRTLSINDEGHFWNCKKYVHDHLFEGAAVLSELIKLAEPRP